MLHAALARYDKYSFGAIPLDRPEGGRKACPRRNAPHPPPLLLHLAALHADASPLSIFARRSVHSRCGEAAGPRGVSRGQRFGRVLDLALYGDEELASIAAATVITDLLSGEPVEDESVLTDAA